MMNVVGIKNLCRGEARYDDPLTLKNDTANSQELPFSRKI